MVGSDRQFSPRVAVTRGFFFNLTEMIMFSVFGWLRRAAAQAVVDGVRDGLVAVADDGEGGAPAPDLAELRKRLAAGMVGGETKALPAAAVGAGETPTAAEGEPAKAGRRR